MRQNILSGCNSPKPLGRVGRVANSGRLGHPNGLIPSHLALKVAPQETHSIVLKKKVTTRY